ncbi:Os03g0851750 [Oryza sativa Japonica Group]|uniref:Os03g0851750 protein n=1 Tax=Oryza sativa subsp. japonica TaxID=39947 RepID=A0A0N7KIE5_ORYSJ|nr:Os03g0851750 [Oryza sativa Japonica Group]
MDLHGGAVVEQEGDAVLAAVAGGVVQRRVLVLVHRVHGRAGLQENLRAFQLAIAASEMQASPPFRILLVLVHAFLQCFLQALNDANALWWMTDSSSYSPSSPPSSSASSCSPPAAAAPSPDGPTPIALPNFCSASGSFQYFIMAAGPPFSISSRMGLREGSSFMRAMRASSCSLWAGLVRPPSMDDMAGSCISALPSRSAIATNCGFCISCCIVDTYLLGSSAGAAAAAASCAAPRAGGDCTVFCSCSAISVNAGSLAICSAISFMLGSLSKFIMVEKSKGLAGGTPLRGGGAAA